MSSPYDRVLVVVVNTGLHACSSLQGGCSFLTEHFGPIFKKKEEWGECGGFAEGWNMLQLERYLTCSMQAWPCCCFTSTQRETNRGACSTKYSDADIAAIWISLRAIELLCPGFYSELHQLLHCCGQVVSLRAVAAHAHVDQVGHERGQCVYKEEMISMHIIISRTTI